MVMWGSFRAHTFHHTADRSWPTLHGLRSALAVDPLTSRQLLGAHINSKPNPTPTQITMTKITLEVDVGEEIYKEEQKRRSQPLNQINPTPDQFWVRALTYSVAELPISCNSCLEEDAEEEEEGRAWISTAEARFKPGTAENTVEIGRPERLKSGVA